MAFFRLYNGRYGFRRRSARRVFKAFSQKWEAGPDFPAWAGF